MKIDSEVLIILSKCTRPPVYEQFLSKNLFSLRPGKINISLIWEKWNSNTLRANEDNILVFNIFSFTHDVFYPFKSKSQNLSLIFSVVSKLLLICTSPFSFMGRFYSPFSQRSRYFLYVCNQSFENTAGEKRNCS